MTEPKTEIVHISTPKAHYTLDLSSKTIRAKPIITNADRIRSMTDEELAIWIFTHRWNDYNSLLDWLKEEGEK